MKDYKISLERGDLNYDELEPNYRAHYEETMERFKADGIGCSPYKPRLEQYFSAFKNGMLLNYVVRLDGEPVGHSNVWLTLDMHNGDLIAKEDTIFIQKEHRCGIGKKLVQEILKDLKVRGCKRGTISPVTDLRVAKIWKRMGFKELATLMTYTFEENANVRA